MKENRNKKVLFLNSIQRRAIILDKVLKTLIVVTAVFAFIIWFLKGQTSFLLSIISLVVFSLLFLLSLLKWIKLSSFLLSIYLMFLGFASIYWGEGIHDVGIILFPGFLLVASLMLSDLEYWIIVVIAVALLSLVGYLEMNGRLVTKFSSLMGERDIPILLMLLSITSYFVRILTDLLYKAQKESNRFAKNYREIFNTAGDGIVILDSENACILDCNTAMLGFLGQPMDEVIGKDIRDWIKYDPPYSLKDAMQWMNKAKTQGPQLFRWKNIIAGDVEVCFNISLKFTEIDGNKCFVAMMQDISQLDAIEKELQQSEKLKALGQLAGGIAHDFNNQLMGIKGYSELLSNDLQNPEHKEYLSMIDKSVSRTAGLTEKLLSFARKGLYKKEEINLKDLLNETIFILHRSLDRKIKIESDYPNEDIIIIGDDSQLQNVFLNLALNSRDAIDDKGSIQFKLSRISEEKVNSLNLNHVVKDCDYAKIEIIDNGKGMDEDTMNKMFDPFFTTKEQGKGTGLGLAAVFGTLEMHEGFIQCNSEIGIGTTISIYLPEAD